MFKRAVAAIALMSTFSAFAGNLVTCGSFECEQVPDGDYGYYTGTSFYGWTVTSGDSIELRNDIVGKAQDGYMFVELDSRANSGMSQTIDTVVGQAYQVSFYASSRPQSDLYNGNSFAGNIVPASSNGLTMTFGTATVSVDTTANPTTGNIWTLYTTTFTATSTQTTLNFQATGTSDSYGTSLDNVSVTAVPEPATYAMMAAGMLMLGALARRRQRGG